MQLCVIRTRFPRDMHLHHVSQTSAELINGVALFDVWGSKGRHFLSMWAPTDRH